MFTFKTIRKYTNRHVIAIILFSLGAEVMVVFGYIFFLHHDSEYIYEKKKCIVLIPGVMASQLFYNGDDNENFKKGEALLMRDYNGTMVDTNIPKSVLKMKNNFEMLLCDSDGMPVNTNVGLLKDKLSCEECDRNYDKYGTLYLFRYLIDSVNCEFGQSTPYKNDIILFNYDWRLDCGYNANKLIKKIIGYDEIIVVAYSLGGLVACKALATMKEKYSLKNIKAYISVCVPYNGAINAFRALNTGHFLSGSLIKFILNITSTAETIRDLCRTYLPVYQLLPTKEFFHRAKDFLKDSVGNEMTYFDMCDYIGNTLKLNKNFINNAIKFHESLFIEGKHILDYIDEKYFFVGVGNAIPSKIQINNKGKDFTMLKYSDADGTVDLENSAIPPVKDIKKEKVYKIKTDHIGVFSNSKFIGHILYILERLIKNQKNPLIS